MSISRALKERIRSPKFREMICDPKDLLHHFRNGQFLGWSGFTHVGYPKAMPKALHEHVVTNELQGKLQFRLICGASAGPDTEAKWAEADMLSHRFAFQVGKPIRNKINDGSIKFIDVHLGMVPMWLDYGYLTKELGPGPSGDLDIGMIECTAITPTGALIPSASLGAAATIARMCKKLIIEVNTSIPDLTGFHDFFYAGKPPHREPINLRDVSDRLGTPYFYVDPAKVIGVVEATTWDMTQQVTDAPSEAEMKISEHLLEFFRQEVRFGRLPENLLPLQSGIGSIANAIVYGLNQSDFFNLKVFSEVIQDGFLDLMDSGRLDHASSTSIRLSYEGFERFYGNLDKYRDKITVRPQGIANSPQLIRQLGVIAMNTPIEFDIYGHANSTCIGGSRMMNGIGGSGDFLRNSKLSIMHTPSTRPTKTDPTGITTIVPMCSHIDHTEHDISVFITEQGVADVRGLSPIDRARHIIEKCVHPDYKDQLKDYLEAAINECTRKKTLHEPHMLQKVFKMYGALEENGSMKLKSWD